MLAIFKVYKGPELRIATEDYMTSSAAIAAIGTALCYILLSVQVCRACSAVSGGQKEFYIIYKI